MENNDTAYTQIFIAKIHPRVSERDLKYKFKKFGEIVDIRLKTGYAFIEFEKPKEAQEAVERMNGKEVEGQAIVVQPSSRNGRRERRRDDDENVDKDRTGRRGPLPEDKCFNCDKSGHWANECREPKKSRFPSRRGDRDEIKCFKCGDRGHKQRFCPKNGRRRSSSSGRNHRRRRSPSRSRSSSSSHSRSRSRSRSISNHRRNNDRRRSRSRSDSSHSRRNYRRKSSENGK